MPASSAAIVWRKLDLVVAERAGLAGLDVEHADHLVVPVERHRQHPGERLDVEAADPREPVVERHVRDRDRLARLRPPAR